MLLIHISDIHFRKGEVGSALDPNAHIRNELSLDAQEQCTRLGTSPKAILISGDIAFSGNTEEYRYALTWLEDLCHRCGTDLTSVFVVPGNHDVDRNIASRPLIQSIHRDIKGTSPVLLEEKLRKLLTDEEAGPKLYEALSSYNNFAGQFFCDLLPPERTISKRDLTLNDRSTLRIVGFNSALVSSSTDKELDLFIDPACLQLIREPGVEYLALCHHPYNWLRQGSNLKDQLNDIARIHLFGHEHTNRIELGRDWVRVAASAAHPDRTEPGWEPGYNLLDLQVEGTGIERYLNIGIHVRVWQSRPGQFRSKKDRDSDVFHQKINLQQWSPPSNPVCRLKDSCTTEVMAQNLASASDESIKIDSMDSLRDIAVRFFKLTLSQKSAIAGKLDLFEENDTNQPDFERFRQVFIRARERNLVEALDRKIKAVTMLSN